MLSIPRHWGYQCIPIGIYYKFQSIVQVIHHDIYFIRQEKTVHTGVVMTLNCTPLASNGQLSQLRFGLVFKLTTPDV